MIYYYQKFVSHTFLSYLYSHLFCQQVTWGFMPHSSVSGADQLTSLFRITSHVLFILLYTTYIIPNLDPLRRSPTLINLRTRSNQYTKLYLPTQHCHLRTQKFPYLAIRTLSLTSCRSFKLPRRSIHIESPHLRWRCHFRCRHSISEYSLITLLKKGGFYSENGLPARQKSSTSF